MSEEVTICRTINDEGIDEGNDSSNHLSTNRNSYQFTLANSNKFH